jgi:hypothetical protein
MGLISVSFHEKTLSLSEMAVGPLKTSQFHWFYNLAGMGQTSFRIGS